MPEPRLLFLINPGRQSRHYILGLVRAAERLRIPYASIQMQDIWDRTASGNAAAVEALQIQIAKLVRANGITHALGYAHNGVTDFGLVRSGPGPARSLLGEIGVQHLLLWTDHPEWATNALALQLPMRDILADPCHTHILKSPAAAAEASQILRWPNITSMPMAEDYEQLPPATGIEPIHDVVAIMGDCQPFPAILKPFLSHDDPDPHVLDQLIQPAAIDRFVSLNPDLGSLARAWLEARAAQPDCSFASLSLRGGGFPTRPENFSTNHAAALTHLRSDPQRWYNAVGTLRISVSWRRFFWPAWLSRRVNVGIYGSSATSMSIEQSSDAAQWVPYDQQPATYALGRIALNTNAAHDEEGLTHKPFQIAASKVPCIHHHTRGLSDCFNLGDEVLSFRRGPELLDHVRSLLGNPTRRVSIAQAMHARARQDHTWDRRLEHLLAHH